MPPVESETHSGEFAIEAPDLRPLIHLQVLRQLHQALLGRLELVRNLQAASLLWSRTNPELEPPSVEDMMLLYVMQISMNDEPATSAKQPISKDDYDALDRAMITAAQERLQKPVCAICQENMKWGTISTKLPCGHMYCTPCIKQWLELQRSCPVCRVEVVGVAKKKLKEVSCEPSPPPPQPRPPTPPVGPSPLGGRDHQDTNARENSNDAFLFLPQPANDTPSPPARESQSVARLRRTVASTRGVEARHSDASSRSSDALPVQLHTIRERLRGGERGIHDLLASRRTTGLANASASHNAGAAHVGPGRLLSRRRLRPSGDAPGSVPRPDGGDGGAPL